MSEKGSVVVWIVIIFLMLLLIAGFAIGWYFWVKRKKDEKPDLCTSGKECKEGEVCDKKSGKCVEKVNCTKDGDCPVKDEYCGPGDFCQPFPRCAKDSDCGSTEQCNSIGLCIPKNTPKGSCPKNASCSSCNKGIDPPSGYKRKDYSECISNWNTRADCKNAPEGTPCYEFQANLCKESGGCGISKDQFNSNGKPWCYYCEKSS